MNEKHKKKENSLDISTKPGGTDPVTSLPSNTGPVSGAPSSLP